MNIGVFYPTLNVYGGGEYVAAVIANTLTTNGYDVALFTNEKLNQKEIKNYFGEKLHDSIKSIVSPSFPQPRGLLDYYQTIFRSYLFKLKCDMWIDAYSNQIYPWTNISYIHFPFLNQEHYKTKFPYLKSRHIRPVGALPYSILEKNLKIDHKKLIIANSHYTAEEIKKFFGINAKVLYPPVSSLHFNDVQDIVNNKRKNQVVTVGRFGPGKGLEKIPYIAALTKSDIHFTIVGRVHFESTFVELQKIIKKLGLTERVKLCPNMPRDKLKELLKESKVYLHTMVGEHFGISIAEAMAMGCVPVVHNSGGAKEFVPENNRYENVQDAAQKIEQSIIEWSQDNVEKTIQSTERFSEEAFSKNFMELFKHYQDNNF